LCRQVTVSPRVPEDDEGSRVGRGMRLGSQESDLAPPAEPSQASVERRSNGSGRREGPVRTRQHCDRGPLRGAGETGDVTSSIISNKDARARGRRCGPKRLAGNRMRESVWECPGAKVNDVDGEAVSYTKS
jgi:hypothetical protein